MRALATVQQQTSRPVLLGMVSSLSAAVCFGTTFVISRHVVVEYSSAPVAAFLSILSGAVLMTIIMSRDLSKDRHAPKRGFILMTLAGMCGAVGAMGSLFALSHAAVTIVTPVIATSPLIILLMAHLFLQRLEQVTPRIWLGAILVVLGVILITLSNA